MLCLERMRIKHAIEWERFYFSDLLQTVYDWLTKQILLSQAWCVTSLPHCWNCNSCWCRGKLLHRSGSWVPVITRVNMNHQGILDLTDEVKKLIKWVFIYHITQIKCHHCHGLMMDVMKMENCFLKYIFKQNSKLIRNCFQPAPTGAIKYVINIIQLISSRPNRNEPGLIQHNRNRGNCWCCKSGTVVLFVT